MKTGPAGVVILAGQFFPVGKTNRMDQDIHLSKHIAGLFGNRRNLLVRSDIAGFDKRAADGSSQGFNPFFNRLARITQTNGGALFVKSLGDAPGNRTIIGNPKNQCCFSL